MTSRRDAENLLASLDDLAYVVDADGTLHQWNDRLADVTGRDDADLATTAFADLFADAQAVRTAVARATEGRRQAVEATLRTVDGPRLYDVSFSPVATGDGAPTAVSGTGHDVTDLRAHERTNEEILDRMTEGFLALDDEWCFTYLNDHGCEVIRAASGKDYTIDELHGRNIWEEIPDAVDTVFYEKYHEAMASQSPVTFDSKYEPIDAWFEVTAYPSETGLSVYFTDVTKERRQREEMEDRERVLRSIHDIIADQNRSFEEQADALMSVGRSVLETEYATLSRVRGDEYTFEYVQSSDGTLTAGETISLSETNCERAVIDMQTLVLEDVARDAPELTDRDGFTEMGISCYLGAPVFVDGDVYGTFCFYDETPREREFSEWDVTLVDMMSRWIGSELARKRVTENLRRQNDRLDQFASIVSHDLRNPLNVAQGRLAIVRDAYDGDDEEIESDLDSIADAHERMEKLVTDLLTMAREGTAVEETERVSLSSVATSAWDTVVTDGATMTVAADRTLDADADRLQQILENLFRNSVEHCDAGVALEVGALPDGFYVEDDGPGIPTEDRGAVFDAGHTTQTGGTGFGLVIVRDLASAHGWSVRVADSEIGGARFEITGVSSQT